MDIKTKSRPSIFTTAITLAIVVGSIYLNKEWIIERSNNGVIHFYRSGDGLYCAEKDYNDAKARDEQRQLNGTADNWYEPCYHGALKQGWKP